MRRHGRRSPRAARDSGSRALVVAVSREGVRAPGETSDAALAEAARMVLRAEKIPGALISIALVTTSRMSVLNAHHLRRRGPTDVIAFGLTGARRALGKKAMPVVGDVYISPSVARANARLLGVAVREELVRLVVHGVLHVLGHTHPDGPTRERSAMWRRQEALVHRALKARTA
ncbi:MAG TPA: rRNA maturation RNase YbeY [Gemmatimonadaceae bacterium]|nr:rRNA maturation RNase YbeY [Gemmatimonadaceae bacterium]